MLETICLQDGSMLRLYITSILLTRSVQIASSIGLHDLPRFRLQPAQIPLIGTCRASSPCTVSQTQTLRRPYRRAVFRPPPVRPFRRPVSMATRQLRAPRLRRRPFLERKAAPTPLMRPFPVKVPGPLFTEPVVSGELMQMAQGPASGCSVPCRRL